MDETREQFMALEGPFFTDERFRNQVIRLNRERILHIDYIDPIKAQLEKCETLQGVDYLYVFKRVAIICQEKLEKFLT